MMYDKPFSAAFSPRSTRVLVLGGTNEARNLAQRMAGEKRLHGVISLAGRTSARLPQDLPVRIGGFGGVEGLIRYLKEARVDKVIDATHPFATRMAANAREACLALGTPLVKLLRAPWKPVAGDRWIEAANQAEAALALGTPPRRAFLTTGRMGLANFLKAPQHFYLIRTIEAPAPADLPPLYETILERGPFDCESEMRLMRAHRIDVLITKNSGGSLTYAKIEAARRLSIDVVMIARLRLDGVKIVHEIEDAMAFLLEGRPS
jgi:precorrin-6A/cobalt-precorrin-6A reductase